MKVFQIENLLIWNVELFDVCARGLFDMKKATGKSKFIPIVNETIDFYQWTITIHGWNRFGEK